ncbi:expressed unknown protein [Seminavis robusta]|uniref:Uncharacterized protein n=1 Tax=Seminavis robusta TaxID=568900 RepID=A0A9N8HWL7_9STRA|nr:expressed unknown protein [Seminavis robusta]|eukprot:Sro2702_g335120.1 n/a (207) ;mRNA; r:6140-6760
MASYAIYLVPRDESLNRAIVSFPQAKKHVDAVQKKKHRGGILHMTLTSFARIKGIPSQGARSNRELHKGDIFNAIERLSVIAADNKEFHISAEFWNDGRIGRRNPDLFIFDLGATTCSSTTEPSSSLKKLGKMLNALNDLDSFTGAKTKVTQLHVSFLQESNPQQDLKEMKQFLALLKWDIAVARISSDSDKGEDLEIIKIAKLGI